MISIYRGKSMKNTKLGIYWKYTYSHIPIFLEIWKYTYLQYTYYFEKIGIFQNRNIPKKKPMPHTRHNFFFQQPHNRYKKSFDEFVVAGVWGGPMGFLRPFLPPPVTHPELDQSHSWPSRLFLIVLLRPTFRKK